METLKKVKIDLKGYFPPVEVKPDTIKYAKTLRNIKKLKISDELKKVLEHPYLDIYDINPDEIIVEDESVFEKNDITVGLSREKLIKDYENFEITEYGKVRKIDITKEITRKSRKISSPEERGREKDIEIEEIQPSFNNVDIIGR